MYNSYRREHPVSVQSQVILLILLALLLLPWLGTTWFNSKGEPREAIVAVSMLQSGNWILPINYGSDIPFKPPFLAWLIAIFAQLLHGGEVNEYISRLPSALACTGMVWAGYRWSCRLRGERFAMVMALVTVTSAEVVRAAVACRLDMVLTACMVTALYQLYRLQERQCRHRRSRWVAVVLLLAAATLTKGPVGTLLPCLIAGIYYLLRGERFWPTLLRLSCVCLLSLLPAAAWYYAAAQQGGEHFTQLMYEENLGRLTGRMSYESHVKPLWYNFTSLLGGMAPWTLLGLLALTVARRFSWRPLKMPGLLCATTFVIVLVFYCIPQSKRSVYLLPLYPAMAYAVTCLILELQHSKVLKTYVWVLALIALAAPVAVTLAACGALSLVSLTLWPAAWWQWPLIWLPAIGGVMWILNRHDTITYAVLLPMVLWLSYLGALQPMVLKPNSDKPLTAAIADAPAVYSLDDPEGIRLFTLNFYTHDSIRSIAADRAALDALPRGSAVIYDTRADSSVFGDHFSRRPLTQRGSDYRRPLGIAVK